MNSGRLAPAPSMLGGGRCNQKTPLKAVASCAGCSALQYDEIEFRLFSRRSSKRTKVTESIAGRVGLRAHVRSARLAPHLSLHRCGTDLRAHKCGNQREGRRVRFDGQVERSRTRQTTGPGRRSPPEAAGPSAALGAACRYRSTGAPTYRSCGASVLLPRPLLWRRGRRR